jgi:hypothetical protein
LEIPGLSNASFGSQGGPPLYDTIEILGKDRTLDRLGRFSRERWVGMTSAEEGAGKRHVRRMANEH